MKKNIVFSIMVIFVLGILILHPGCKESDDTSTTDTGFIGKMWVLQGISYAGIGQTFLQGDFWVMFNEDGTFDMGADCNTCGGSYTLGDSGEMSFPDSFMCTEVLCDANSGDTEFKAAMNRVVSYQYGSGEEQYLALFFINESNWLYFERQ